MVKPSHFCWAVPINDTNTGQLNNLKLAYFSEGENELSMLSGFSAWLNLNYHFSLRFYFEGNGGSHWYRTVSRKQVLLIAFWEKEITSWSIGKLKNEQIWTGFHCLKLFGIQIGGYRINTAKTCIWFTAIKKTNILLNKRHREYFV